jgi:hypothetical protein
VRDGCGETHPMMFTALHESTCFSLEVSHNR